ncbi:hypothetical protein RFI_13426, partial [Reticulomyxa filosa]
KMEYMENVDEVYEIWHGSIGDKAMKEYHDRLQFLLLLYIESCSYIDPTDYTWEVMLLFAKNKTTGKYTVIGYLTLYVFYVYPNNEKRLRISQVLIFPPFQRNGHGFELLQHVHFMVRYRHYLQVNVEDPAPNFQFLRDSIDVFNACVCHVFTFGFCCLYINIYIYIFIYCLLSCVCIQIIASIHFREK